MPGRPAAHHNAIAPQFSDSALLEDLVRVWELCGTERLQQTPALEEAPAHLRELKENFNEPLWLKPEVL